MTTERRVGVAVDFSACSKKALNWAIDNIVRKGDHLILVTVRPEGNYEEREIQLWQTTGSHGATTDLVAREREIVGKRGTDVRGGFSNTDEAKI